MLLRGSHIFVEAERDDVAEVESLLSVKSDQLGVEH